MPLPRSRNWREDWVPWGRVTLARVPSIVGISTAPPRAAVVIGIGTRQNSVVPSRSNKLCGLTEMKI